MGSALIGGLLSSGVSVNDICVVDNHDLARSSLKTRHGINALPTATTSVSDSDVIVWAVKPQNFKEATKEIREFAQKPLHLSVAAGISTEAISRWLGTDRVVRAMPNTPALVGRGMTGLFASLAVNTEEKELVEKVIKPTGKMLWVDDESKIDIVTAMSGSGPAYVFLFLEAMTQAGVDMGLTPEQSYELAITTFEGASELARRSDESPKMLRERVTSKGGTTHAALTHMLEQRIPEQFVVAIKRAEKRAKEMGTEFGS